MAITGNQMLPLETEHAMSDANDGTYYRERAKTARRLGASAENIRVRTIHQSMADDYEMLAKYADDPDQPDITRPTNWVRA